MIEEAGQMTELEDGSKQIELPSGIVVVKKPDGSAKVSYPDRPTRTIPALTPRLRLEDGSIVFDERFIKR